MTVSRETEDRLANYAALLRRWNPVINLVGPATLDQLEERHISDSLQLLQIRPNPGALWVDLGSGGGLPGIPVACALHGGDTKVVLVESDARKAAFLRRAVSSLDLQAEVMNLRAEAMPPANADTVSARALAPLPKLLSYVCRHLAFDGTALLHKGKTWEDELQAARVQWDFDVEVHSSQTSERGVVLELRNICVR